jgi:hypothetical protein
MRLLCDRGSSDWTPIVAALLAAGFGRIAANAGIYWVWSAMYSDLLRAKEAARLLGMRVTTLYAWLGLSDYGLLVIRGQPATIHYYQGGPSGQGRIQIEAAEVDRVRELMRVVPQKPPTRRPQMRRDQLPGIKVPLGRPAQ